MARLRYIDCWRAVAVLMVLTEHLGFFPTIHAQLVAVHLDAIANWGPTGVYIFFFISGYVVSRVCLQELRTDAFSSKGFYVRRSFRIIPPLALYLVTCLALGSLSLRDFASAFLYQCNNSLPTTSCPWANSHTWSLSFEEQFYLMFPALLLLVHLRKRPNVTLFAIALALFVIPFFFPIWIGRAGFVATHCLFAGGYLCARFERQITLVLRQHAVAYFVVSLALTLGASKIFHLGAILLQVSNYEAPTTIPLLFVATIPVMVLSSGLINVRAGWLAPPAAYVGKVSYSIYLWQQLATSESMRWMNLAQGALLAVLLILWCALLYELMERRLIRLGHRLSKSVTGRHPILNS